MPAVYPRQSFITFVILFYFTLFSSGFYCIMHIISFRETTVGGRCCLDIGFRHTVPAAYPRQSLVNFVILFLLLLSLLLLSLSLLLLSLLLLLLLLLFRQTTVLMKLLFPFSFNVDPKHNFRVKHIESHMQTSYSKYLLSHKIHGLD